MTVKRLQEEAPRSNMDERTTGDEPMTGGLRSYLKTLSEEAGVPVGGGEPPAGPGRVRGVTCAARRIASFLTRPASPSLVRASRACKPQWAPGRLHPRGVRKAQVGPRARVSRRSKVASGSRIASAMATYHAS